MQVGIEVNLDHTVSNSIQTLLLRRAKTTVENQENWFVFLPTNGILYVLLVLSQEFWVELDVTRFVDIVNISKASDERKIR